MTNARITGTGSFVPRRVLSNDDLSHILGEDINEFVSQVIGIEERHICAETESTADLATEAASRALDLGCGTASPRSGQRRNVRSQLRLRWFRHGAGYRVEVHHRGCCLQKGS